MGSVIFELLTTILRVVLVSCLKSQEKTVSRYKLTMVAIWTLRGEESKLYLTSQGDRAVVVS